MTEAAARGCFIAIESLKPQLFEYVTPSSMTLLAALVAVYGSDAQSHRAEVERLNPFCQRLPSHRAPKSPWSPRYHVNDPKPARGRKHRAIIELTDSPQTSYGGPSSSSAVLGRSVVDSVARALQTGYAPTESSATRIVNTVQFSYSSDVLQLGDPFSLVIPDPRGTYRDKFW